MKATVIFAMHGNLKLKLEDGRTLVVPADSARGMCKFIQYGDTGTLYNDDKQRTKFMIDAEDMLPPVQIHDIITPTLNKDDNMRHLASIKRIDSISSIEGADMIDAATIGGWTVVVKKGLHNVGELVTYFEIDSWLPEAIAPFLVNPDSPKVYENIAGVRLRTKKLKGVVSQGLIIATSELPQLNDIEIIEDLDVTEVLGVLKYEPPIPACLSGVARGNFPSFIPKTDQERVQNLKSDDFERYIGAHFEVTEKLDGSSCTVYANQELDGSVRFGVCSRNLDLTETEGNSFWSTARARGFIDVLSAIGQSIAIQAELVGPGVQGNKYGLSSLNLYVFDIYDINAAKYLTAEERDILCKAHNLTQAPVIEILEFTSEHDRAYFISNADGKSVLNDSLREGLVYKCVEQPDISFKAISNKWLLKNDSRD